MAITLPGASNGRIALPNVTTLGGLTALSACITINVSSLATNERLFGQWGSIGRSMLVTITDTDEIGFVVASNDSNFFGVKTTATNLAAGLHRFGFRWQPQTGDDDMEIYLDGVAQTTTVWFASAVTALQSVTDDLEIGHETESVLDGVEGDYAEFALWGAYLSADTMQALGKGFSPAFFKANRLHYVPLVNTSHLVDLDGNSSPTNTAGTNAQHPGVIYPSGARYGIPASGVSIAVPNANTITVQANTPSVTAAAGATVISPVATVSFGAQTPQAKGGASVRPAAASVLLSNGVPSITASAGGFTAHGVEFDTTPTYLTRGAGLTGASDGNAVSGSLWFNSSVAAVQRMLSSTGDTMRATVDSAGKLVIAAENAAGGTVLQINSTIGVDYRDGAWHHACWSAQLDDTAKRSLLVDRQNVLNVVTYSNDTIDLTVADWSIGATVTGTVPVQGCLAEVWFDDVYVDWNDAATLAKVIDSDGRPVSLGADGSAVTGAAPLLYFGGNGQEAAGWETNKGTGGGFTENGTLADCATDPPGFRAVASIITILPATPSIIASGPARVNALASEISINTQTPVISAFERATVQATPASIILANGLPTISAQQFATVQSVDTSIIFTPQVPVVDAAPFLAINVTAASLEFDVQDVFIDSTNEFRTAGVSLGEGVSFPEGVTDIRMTVGQAGVNDEAEEES